ncbi:GNAT family N-acetyltransferase [Chelatococcus sp. SYSU_G07232]|uniref:GNAT family N-acetyltransferase n=1 Tax=Chelatococcus albus TaxID=3047466 RepID=A0ABT7AEE8_9HYPH|nr:GNAT family N-acetyltransferase [Chelatococcus sp. SYSU_G07232]MDJ1157741.1 GNAT family N-acetyltransferase [Chelatococcus sp. SYSU_G07232]
MPEAAPLTTECRQRSASAAEARPGERRGRPEVSRGLIGLTWTVHGRFGEVEGAWRDLEARSDATPYQRFDFLSAWFETIGERMGATPAVVAGRDAEGAVEILLPLAVARRFGLRIATCPGGRHANFCLPLVSRNLAGAIDARALTQVLDEAVVSSGLADVVVLRNLPGRWRGRGNPLLGGRPLPAPDPGFGLVLDGPAEEVAARILSKSRRKKLRYKMQALGRLGAFGIARIEPERDAARVLSAFLAQKAERFREMGQRNPFAEPGAEAFLARLAAARRGRPAALELYALQLDARVVAVLGGASDGREFSAMFLSYETEPTVAAFSPGDVLVANVIADLCDRGFHWFDLGVGEAAYKHRYCPERIETFTRVEGLTLKGRLAALVLMALERLRFAVKTRPRLLRLALSVQRRTGFGMA